MIFPKAHEFKRRQGIGGTAFDLDTFRALAFASQLAYSKGSEIEAVAVKSGAKYFNFIDDKKTDTQVFIAASENEVVISFRGTEKIKDWITDAKMRRRAWDGQSVHRGFADAYDSVADEIQSSLISACNGRQVVWITGHSLGGAHATLCAYDLRNYGRANPFGVYTFGSPRVGSKAFAESYDFNLKDRTFRIVNAQDIVARVPGVLIGYRHVGTEIFLNSSNQIEVNPSLGSKLVSDIRGLAQELDPVFVVSSVAKVPLQNHFINSYLERFSRS